MRMKDTRKFGKTRFVLKFDTKKLGDRANWRQREIKSLVKYEVARFKADGWRVRVTSYGKNDYRVWVFPK